MERIKRALKALWCHRTVYAAIAGAYLALCLGVDKALVEQAMAALYAALAAQRH